MDSQTIKSPTTLADRRSAARNKESAEYGATRDRILRGAADVLRKKGISGATLGAIAKEAAVDRATIYYYFPDKFDVIRAVVKDALQDMLTELDREVARDRSPSDRLRACCRAIMSAQERHFPYLYIFLKEGMSSGIVDTRLEEDFLFSGLRCKQLLRQIIQAGIDAGEFNPGSHVKIITNMIVGMLNWTHDWFRPDGKLSGEEVADRMVAVIFSGIAQKQARKVRKSSD
jgi:AcrR family transcriptional regulator